MAPESERANYMQRLPGGMCFAHGRYTGMECPKWPACATDRQNPDFVREGMRDVTNPDEPTLTCSEVVDKLRANISNQEACEKILLEWQDSELATASELMTKSGFTLLAVTEKYKAATADLARVRGLLQRQSEDFKSYGRHLPTCWSIQARSADHCDCGFKEASRQNSETTVSPAVEGQRTKRDSPSGRRTTDLAAADKSVEYSSQNPTFPQSSSPVSQGAESADIGKLEAADKKCAYCKHTHTFQFDEIVDDDCPVVGCPCMHFLGSAETGGEKAAPLSDSQMQMWIAVEMFEDDWDEPRPAWEDLSEADRNSYIKMAGAAIRVFGVSNFRRSTESESASSGVDGAHEGTTADKSGSRFHGEWFCPKCKQKTVNIYLPDSYDEPDATAHFRCENCDWFGDSRVEPTPDSREPEKLNSAHTLRRAEEIAEQHQCDDICKIEGCGYKIADDISALAESSLSQKCDVCHLTLDDMGNCFNCGSELDSDQKRDAKKRCNICGDKKCICDEYGHRNPHNSESSLSSPPPPGDE